MTPGTGRIFDIQRFSIHDGPGIRTTVFLKGCPLRCVWCHNPEGMHAAAQLSFLPDKCIACGECVRGCPEGAHRSENGRHVLDRAKCKVCGKCAAECCAQSLEIVGRDAGVQEVLDEVLRDKAFYEVSGGGLTLSGGEPLAQAGFTAALLEGAKQNGLHCCVETCGFAEQAAFERIAAWVDMFLFDIKETDEARHLAFTGVSNELILRNLRRLHARGAKILVRLPLVPGFNATDGHFAGVARLAEELPNLLGVEVLPYHPLGAGKSARFGSRGNDLGVALPLPETVAQWVQRLKSLGVRVINRND